MTRRLNSMILLAGILGCLATARGQNPSGVYSGPAILTVYQVPDKPQKIKTRVTIVLNSASNNSTFQQENDTANSGSAYMEFGYLWAKYQQGAAVLAGRLKAKGTPGQETGFSGTLISTFNGYAGMYEFKVNLKKE